MSVGKVSLVINFFVYGICLLLFDVERVMYCLFFGAVYSFVCDRVHIQNINVSVTILTKDPGVSKTVAEWTGRAVTDWASVESGSGGEMYVLLAVISKDEEKRLIRMVKGRDSKAVMIFTEGCFVSGNFEKRLYP